MDTSQKLIIMGISFIVTGLLIAFGIVRRVFPDQDRARRMWWVVIPGIIVGISFVAIGLVIG